MTGPSRYEIETRLNALEREVEADEGIGIVDWFAELKKAEVHNQNQNQNRGWDRDLEENGQ